MGPLLFLIYINDIINCSKTSRFVLFADDTNIFISANNESEAYEIANKTLEDLQRYMLSNQLHINLSKCTYMHFRPDLNNEERQISARTLPHSYHLKHKLFILRKVNDYMHVNKLHINMEKCCFIHFKPGNNENAVTAEFDVNIGDKIIKQVSETKFLGITIDNKLSWDTHINKLSKKLSCATGILNRIKDNIPSELHKNLYHTLFESHLAYGITAWGGVSDKKLQSLFKVQKRCLRIIFGDKETYLNKFKTCCRVRPYDHQK